MLQLRQEFAHLVRHEFGPERRDGPVVLMCVDPAYAKYARVTLVSLLLNTSRRDLRLVVLGSWDVESELREFARLASLFGASLTLIHLPDDALPAVLTGIAHLSRATYLRLLAPQILDVEWLLYLDSDLIVQSEISPLLELYDADSTVGAVEDRIGGRQRSAALRIANGGRYFNCGVLLLNCRRWRDNIVFRRSLAFYVENKQDVVYADQDILNVLLEKDKYLLPKKWNVMATEYEPYSLASHLNADTFDGIFHFSGEFKPWMRWADPWARDFYLRYARAFGIPDGFWRNPRTIREKRLLARAAEAERDFARAYLILKVVVQELADEYLRVMQGAEANGGKLVGERTAELRPDRPDAERDSEEI